MEVVTIYPGKGIRKRVIDFKEVKGGKGYYFKRVWLTYYYSGSYSGYDSRKK